jgi:hypothetical protein
MGAWPSSDAKYPDFLHMAPHLVNHCSEYHKKKLNGTLQLTGADVHCANLENILIYAGLHQTLGNEPFYEQVSSVTYSMPEIGQRIDEHIARNVVGLCGGNIEEAVRLSALHKQSYTNLLNKEDVFSKLYFATKNGSM